MTAVDSNPRSSYHELYLLQANQQRVFVSEKQIILFYIKAPLFFFFQWVQILASVEIAPFWEIYKYDRKTGKVVDGSIPLHTTFNQTLFVRLQTTFSAPGLIGPPGASSVWIVCPNVCLSICPFIRLSVIPSRLQTKCNIQSYGGHTVTKLGL